MLAIRIFAFCLMAVLPLQDALAQQRQGRQQGGGQQQLTRPQPHQQGQRGDDRERTRERTDRGDRQQRMTQDQRDQLRKDIQDANRDIERRR